MKKLGNYINMEENYELHETNYDYSLTKKISGIKNLATASLCGIVAGVAIIGVGSMGYSYDDFFSRLSNLGREEIKQISYYVSGIGIIISGLSFASLIGFQKYGDKIIDEKLKRLEEVLKKEKVKKTS